MPCFYDLWLVTKAYSQSQNPLEEMHAQVKNARNQ